MIQYCSYWHIVITFFYLKTHSNKQTKISTVLTRKKENKVSCINMTSPTLNAQTRLLLYIFEVYVIITACNGQYHLSRNQFTWHQALKWCRTYCHSDLASIHNTQQLMSALNVLYNFEMINRSHGHSMNAWIGLYKKHAKPFQPYLWSDTTLFDFGAHLISSIDADHNCTSMTPSNDLCTSPYVWIPTDCNIKQNFLCSSCDGKFSKYIVIQETNNFTNSEANCKNVYGANLASIHSNEDYLEA